MKTTITMFVSGTHTDVSAVTDQFRLPEIFIAENLAPKPFCEIVVPDSEDNRMVVKEMSALFVERNALRTVELRTEY